MLGLCIGFTFLITVLTLLLIFWIWFIIKMAEYTYDLIECIYIYEVPKWKEKWRKNK